MSDDGPNLSLHTHTIHTHTGSPFKEKTARLGHKFILRCELGKISHFLATDCKQKTDFINLMYLKIDQSISMSKLDVSSMPFADILIVKRCCG